MNTFYGAFKILSMACHGYSVDIQFGDYRKRYQSDMQAHESKINLKYLGKPKNNKQKQIINRRTITLYKTHETILVTTQH